MAEISNPIGGVNLPARPLSPARSEAIRTAQRAFFEAALAGVQAAQPVSSAPQTKVAPAQPAQAAKLDLSSPPDRIVRPGSLLDIKI